MEQNTPASQQSLDEMALQISTLLTEQQQLTIEKLNLTPKKSNTPVKTIRLTRTLQRKTKRYHQTITDCRAKLDQTKESSKEERTLPCR
jgi:hypothetical protein